MGPGLTVQSPSFGISLYIYIYRTCREREDCYSYRIHTYILLYIYSHIIIYLNINLRSTSWFCYVLLNGVTLLCCSCHLGITPSNSSIGCLFLPAKARQKHQRLAIPTLQAFHRFDEDSSGKIDVLEMVEMPIGRRRGRRGTKWIRTVRV